MFLKIFVTFPSKNQKNRFKKILAVVASFVFVYAIIVGLLFLNPGGIFDGLIGDPTSDVVASLIDGDYEDTLLLVEDVDNDTLLLVEDVDNDTLHEQLSARLNTLSADFLAEEIEFAVVIMELDTIERMDIPELEGQLGETRDYINNLNASRIAFNTAEAFYENGNYLQAIAQYDLVILDDPNYELAREGISRAANPFRADALESARSYSVDNDYENAIRVLDEALLVLPDDAEITQQLNLYLAIHAKVLGPYELYGGVLASYQELINYDFFSRDISGFQEWAEPIGRVSSLWSSFGNSLSVVNYAFFDIDGNGIPELLVGTDYNSHELLVRSDYNLRGEPKLFDIFTWNNGQVIHLVGAHATQAGIQRLEIHNNGMIIDRNGISYGFNELSSGGHSLDRLFGIRSLCCGILGGVRVISEGDGLREISESEFENILAQYTSSGVVEGIEWRTLGDN